jgi:hypothetical protein
VTAQDDAVLAALERAWTAIRTQDDHIPAVAVEIGPGRGSSCISVGWDQRWPVVQVNLMRDDRKATGAEVLERLLHQGAHAITHDPDRPVTTTEGRWHSTAYREAADRLGLTANLTSSTAAGTGWSATSLARGTLTRYRAEVSALDRALQRWEPTQQVKTRRDSRNPAAATCSCVPPRKIRVQERTLLLGDITCEICQKPFMLAETSDLSQPISRSAS